MKKEDTIKSILTNKVLAVVRMKDSEKLLKVIEAIMSGGVTGIELTMTIPNAIEAITKAAKEFGNEIMLGVGSVTDAETAERAIEAGAEFVVSPVYKEKGV